MNELDIFSAALDLTDPAERSRFLDEACADSSELRHRIEALLSNAARASQFLEAPAPEFQATLDLPITEKPGTQIGPYKLLQQLGEGGMGVVYMAEQKEPVNRRVALKIIKPGMDTRQVIARFEAERQALAMMDHPNIAKALDAGATESGRPYFVMELVNGVSITQYCDEQHLTPKERLELFVPICQAVQHAHQKGIIHRDLKPSNILVAEYDHRAVPKIIDFGVAKAMSQTLTEKTMFTQLGQIVGTLEYMSPEQAQRNQLDIDTRSDIYSLGVVLYELLSGETPFDRERLSSAAFDEMLRIIREEEPSKPSTKVSGSASLPSIAANRRTEPAKLGSMIRGELDWIVLKAMEKDRGRRYETASKFAEDVQHYLNDEAVVACPPSRAYKFRKFARRNKGLLTAVSAVAVALLLGTVVSMTQAIRATRAEKAEAIEHAKADQEWKRAEENLALANTEMTRAEGNLDLALTALDAVYLEAIGEEKLLGRPHSAAPNADEMDGSYDLSLSELEKDLLRRGLGFYEQFAHQNASAPRAENQTAKAYYRVALLQNALGDHEDAQENYREAIAGFEELAQRDAENAEHVIALSRAYRGLAHSLHNWDSAKALYGKSVSALTTAIRLRPRDGQLYIERAWGYEHLKQRRHQLEDFKQAVALRPEDALLRAVIAQRIRFGEGSADAGFSAGLIEEALRIDPDEPRVQIAAGMVSISVLHDQKRAREHLSRALDVDTNDPVILDKRSELCGALRDYGQMISDAEQAARLAPQNGRYRVRVAEAHVYQGHYGQALKELDKAEAVAPNERTIHTLRGDIHSWQRKYEPALVAFNRAIEIEPAAWILKRRAAAHYYLGHYDEALADLRSSIGLRATDRSTLTWIPLKDMTACLDEDFRKGVLVLADEVVKINDGAAWACLVLGSLQKAMGDHAQAVASFSRAIESAPESPIAWLRRGRTYAAMGDDDLAGRDFDKYIELFSRAVEESPQQASVWSRRAKALGEIGQWEKAIDDYTEAIQRNPKSPALYKNRAETYCLLARWKEAAGDLSKAVDSGDESVVTAYWRALAELGSGDTDAYRRDCAAVIEHYGQSGEAGTLNWVAWTCVLAEDAVSDPPGVVDIAKLAVTKQPDNDNYRKTLGAALYRSGRYREAAEELIRVTDAWEEADLKPTQYSPAYAWYFLAMTRQRLGHGDEAVGLLKKAVDRTDAVLAADRTEGAGPPWNRRLTLELLRREAENLSDAPEDAAKRVEETERRPP